MPNHPAIVNIAVLILYYSCWIMLLLFGILSSVKLKASLSYLRRTKKKESYSKEQSPINSRSFYFCLLLLYVLFVSPSMWKGASSVRTSVSRTWSAIHFCYAEAVKEASAQCWSYGYCWLWSWITFAHVFTSLHGTRFKVLHMLEISLTQNVPDHWKLPSDLFLYISSLLFTCSRIVAAPL